MSVNSSSNLCSLNISARKKKLRGVLSGNITLPIHHAAGWFGVESHAVVNKMSVVLNWSVGRRLDAG